MNAQKWSKYASVLFLTYSSDGGGWLMAHLCRFTPDNKPV
jgi:hypothetical protein